MIYMYRGKSKQKGSTISFLWQEHRLHHAHEYLHKGNDLERG